jgi:sulfofructosephosphate aldolase
VPELAQVDSNVSLLVIFRTFATVSDYGLILEERCMSAGGTACAKLAERARLLERLQTPAGRYAMLALDQRESLRAMYSLTAEGEFAGDDELRDFKTLGSAVLSPFATAVLLDRPFGLGSARPPGISPECGLIVAVDILHQAPGQAITHVSFDHLVTPELLATVGADAIKVLVLWRRNAGKKERAELVGRAIELAREAGVACLVEGIVRPDEPDGVWSHPSERHDAILNCAAELIEFDPDIYKAEVPGYIEGDVGGVSAQSAELTSIVGRDWVVLSNGVKRDEFAAAVSEALRGGASGFLAGRAIWADAVAERDIAAALRDRSIDRLKRLREIVDSTGRAV